MCFFLEEDDDDEGDELLGIIGRFSSVLRGAAVEEIDPAPEMGVVGAGVDVQGSSAEVDADDDEEDEDDVSDGGRMTT